MEVEIMSSQFIKPSSPTPHPKTHKLSILDQSVPRMYIPMVFFYSAVMSTQATIGDITQQKLKQLKESLSQVLIQFYPFAGRLKDKHTIDCNDEGVHYTEAKINCTLVEFFNQSNFSSFLRKFLPNQPIMEVGTEGYTFMVQVTCFACGGMVIGTLISHTLVDGAAASVFLNAWGSKSRSDDHQFQQAFELPNFDSPFPRNFACPQTTNVMAFWGQILNLGRVATRRFLFNVDAIAKLKAQGSSSIVQNPTRVEVITSLLCKCIAKVFKANSSLEKPTVITHAVNMRRRASPNFPTSYMGNIVWLVSVLMSAKDNVADKLPNFIIKLREAVTSINSNFVKGFQGEEGFANFCKLVKKEVHEKISIIAPTSGINNVNYTSWCNFGLYDVDYGWGKPIWVSSVAVSSSNTNFFNTVILMDTPLGNGVEVLVILNEDEMTILQQDKELLQFATLDPNPLRLTDHASHT